MPIFSREYPTRRDCDVIERRKLEQKLDPGRGWGTGSSFDAFISQRLRGSLREPSWCSRRSLLSMHMLELRIAIDPLPLLGVPSRSISEVLMGRSQHDRL